MPFKPRTLAKRVASKSVCTLFVASLCLGLLPLSAHANDENAIPELGDPSSQILSPAKEREIGRQFYLQARQHPTFINDLEVAHYIQSLGNRLINRNDLGNDKFTFFVFNNSAINAFAVPGGYIGFYSGLINLAQNESQLASVVAHEIAHVTQRHLARFYAKQEGVSLATTAAILAGIIAGAQGNAQAGSATIYAGIAASQQAQINFTRSHEQEADRIGIQFMANSEYDTKSMAAMFDVMQRASLQGESERYEFLRTHPLTSRRVAEARTRANQHTQNRAIVNSVDFQLIKGRLEVLTADNLQQLQRRYEGLYKENQDLQNAYTLAFLHQEQASPEQATRYIDKLMQLAPESITVLLLKARNMIELGQFDQALSLYTDLFRNYPFNYPIVDVYTRTLERRKEHDKATVVLQDYLFNAPQPHVEAYKRLAFHQKSNHQAAASRLNMANYFLEIGEPDSAFSQLKLALKEPGTSIEEEQRIKAKLEEVKDVRQQQKQ